MSAMAWTKLSAGIFASPWALIVDRDATLVHIECMVWSNQQGTDGNIPKNGIRRITTSPDPEGAVAQLVGCGVWADGGSSWVLVGFHKDQPRAADTEQRVQDKRAADARYYAHTALKHHATCRPGCKGSKTHAVPALVSSDSVARSEPIPIIGIGSSDELRTYERSEYVRNTPTPFRADALTAAAANHEKRIGEYFEVTVDTDDTTDTDWEIVVSPSRELPREWVLGILNQLDDMPGIRGWQKHLDEVDRTFTLWAPPRLGEQLFRMAEQYAHEATDDPDDLYGQAS